MRYERCDVPQRMLFQEFLLQRPGNCSLGGTQYKGDLYSLLPFYLIIMVRSSHRLWRTVTISILSPCSVHEMRGSKRHLTMALRTKTIICKSIFSISKLFARLPTLYNHYSSSRLQNFCCLSSSTTLAFRYFWLVAVAPTKTLPCNFSFSYVHSTFIIYGRWRGPR